MESLINVVNLKVLLDYVEDLNFMKLSIAS